MPNNAPKHFFEVDDVFANYTIVHFCGRGAYGEVYLAEDITHKTVALKIIPISSGSEVWRMELIGLRHYRQSIEDYKSLIEIFHVGETENFFYYTMEAADNMLHGNSDEEEYVPDTLSHRLELGGRLEPEKVLELAFTLLDALEQLAEHDLAHRDIKPANIVFINGQAKLSDIGLISATGVRSKVVGTVDFMPPESSDGDPVEYGRDLYALGKVLYCALTGLLPENYPEVPLTVPLRAWRQFKNVLLRACSPDPRQRFYTPEAFRKALPHEIHATTFVDESMEHVRTYRKQHPVAWRLSIISVILIFAALLLSSFLALHMRQEFRQIQQQRKNFIFRTIDLLNDRSLQLQRIAAGSGNTARSWQLQSIAELASNTRADGDWEATERYCRIADAHLRVWAGEEFRLLQEKYPLEPLPLNHNKLQKMLEAYSNFQSTVLAEYLPESLRIQLQNSIEQMQQKLSDLWHGPILGSNWHSPLTGNMQFIYIPAGKLPGEPTDSFWMSSSEATCELFNRLRPGSGRKFLPPNLPVTNISWNDRLELCRLLTLQAKKMRILPDGYIFRLPYANEWNFVLQGAWQSAAHFIHEQQSVDSYAWYGANSMYQVHEVSTKAPGLMGFYDMIGNVAESVLMRPTLPGKQPQAGNFGASFRNRRVSSEINHTTSIDMLENNWSGFRLVLGRGTMDYFDHNWYLGEKRQIRQQDHIYELLGSPACRWNGELALAWCKMLDVEPLMMPEKTLRKKLYNAHERVRELPTLLGAFYKNAQWMWLSGVPLNYGEWLIHNNEGNTAEQGEYLVWDHGFWRSIKSTGQVPQLIVRYPRQRLFTPRQQITSSVILKKLTMNNKNYYLLQGSFDWYTAKRLAEMLGGKLAEFHKQADQQKVLVLLKEYAHLRIALGGFRKHAAWQWLSGTPGPKMLPANRTFRSKSLNSYFVAIHGGRFCSTDCMDAFLCEIP